MPGTHHFRALTIFISCLLAAAFASAGCGLVLPSSITGAPQPASSTAQIAGAPSPSATLQPSATPTAIPLTATPIPSLDGPRAAYENQISAQITQLLHGGIPAPSGFQMPPPDQRQIILLPKNERLYSLQTLLSPQITGGGGDDAPLKLYVIYWYERGQDLYYESSPAFPSSQALTVHVQLVGIAYGHAYTFDGFDNDSGAALDDRDMLEKTVLPLQILGDQAAQVQSAVELMIGYGMGLDWDAAISPQLRTELLRPALQSENWSDRMQAARSLQKLGSAAAPALPDLIKAMEVEEDQFVVAQSMLQAVAAIQPDILPVKLDNTSANPLQDILSDPANITALAGALSASDWEERALAAVILSRGGTAAIQGVPGLMGIIHDPNPHVRSAVVSALGQLAPNITGVVPALIQAQSDDAAEVRISANRIFRYDRSQAQTVVPALIQALGDSDNNVRLTAIQSLQWLGRDAFQAVPPLINTLKDPDADIQAAASQALYYITNQGSGDDAASWRNWWQQQLNKTTTPQPTETYTGTF
ncbi:MAG: HEAT repeat domain-containing protein [Anaerolineaceae bacterium]|nr:HEAT repeat domain-containing protein [Anaerolineaceae bacterium]